MRPHHTKATKTQETKFPGNYLSKPEIRAHILAKTGGNCAYCGDHIADKFVIDHVVPFHSGGTLDHDNLLPSCWSCNSVKSNRSLEVFRRLLSRRKHNMPSFTDEQVKWVKRNHGLDLTPPYIEFWFEKHLR